MMAAKLERYVTSIPAAEYLKLAIPVGQPRNYSDIKFFPIVGWTIITELKPNLPPINFSQPVGIDPLPAVWAIYDTRTKSFIMPEEHIVCSPEEALAYFNQI